GVLRPRRRLSVRSLTTARHSTPVDAPTFTESPQHRGLWGRRAPAGGRPRMMAEPALAPAEALGVLESVPAGVAVCGRDLRWVAWNRTMEAFTGLAAEDVLGERAAEVGAALAGDDAAGLLQTVLAGI